MDVGKVYADAQVGVLGCLLIDGDRQGAHILGKCRSEDFGDPTYRHIFDGIMRLSCSGRPIDPVLLLGEIGKDYAPTLKAIMEQVPTVTLADAYIRELKDSADLLRIQSAALGIAGAATLKDARAALSAATALLSQRRDARVTSFAQGLADFYSRGEEQKADYLDWGLGSLNNYLYAEQGDFVVIGAEPSVGKTVLALQLGWHFAKGGKKVGMFSLETSDRKLYDRLISHAGRIDFSRIKRQQLDMEDFDALRPLTNWANDIQLDVIAASGMTVDDIRALAISRGYEIIFIDYLQLIRSTGTRYNRQEEVANISMSLHTFAQENGVTVIALSQLSRPEKKGEPRRPTLHDLRESGQLEQDADIVMLMSYEDLKSKRSDGDRRLEIQKNKEGERGQLLLKFDPEHMDFYTARLTLAGPDPGAPTFTELPEGEQEAIPF